MEGVARRIGRVALALGAGAWVSGCLQRVTWLPDGQRLAYVQDATVWVVDLAGRRSKLYEAPGETPSEVSASPVAPNLAIITSGAGFTKLVFVTDRAAPVWSWSRPGGAPDKPDWLFVPDGWSPDGRGVLIGGERTATFVSPGGRTATVLPAAVAAARCSGSGDLLVLTGTCSGGLAFAQQDAHGLRSAPIRWPVPADTPDDAMYHLTVDGQELWISASGPPARRVLVDRTGREVFRSERGWSAPGPDDRSYVTKDGGWALVRVGGPVVNLNPVYARLQQADLNWQLADPAALTGEQKPDLEFTGWPAWSPDGKRVAVVTKRLLAVADPATGEVSALAKW